jgi:hypothetical protein
MLFLLLSSSLLFILRVLYALCVKSCRFFFFSSSCLSVLCALCENLLLLFLLLRLAGLTKWAFSVNMVAGGNCLSWQAAIQPRRRFGR